MWIGSHVDISCLRNVITVSIISPDANIAGLQFTLEEKKQFNNQKRMIYYTINLNNYKVCHLAEDCQVS